jgi:hypothetical protein
MIGDWGGETGRNAGGNQLKHLDTGSAKTQMPGCDVFAFYSAQYHCSSSDN